MTTTWKAGDEPIDGYTLTEYFGRGPYGELWMAVDAAARPVAANVMALAPTAAAERELASLDRIRHLDHPNVVPVAAAGLLDANRRAVPFGAADARYLVVITRGGRQTLADRLRQLNPRGTAPADIRGIPLPELLPYLADAAAGIDYLNGHAALVHCGVSPDSLQLAADGRVLVADSGLAVTLTQDPRSSRPDGAPYFRPMELANGTPGPRTDQYSLAVSYYELRTGRLPFPPGAGPGDVLIAHATGTLDFSSAQVTEAEREVLRRATAVNPGERYESCVLFYRAIKKAVKPLVDEDDSLPQTIPSVDQSGPPFGLTPTNVELTLPAPPPNLTPTNLEIKLDADAVNPTFPSLPSVRSLPDLPGPPTNIPTAAELHTGTKESRDLPGGVPIDPDDPAGPKPGGVKIEGPLAEILREKRGQRKLDQTPADPPPPADMWRTMPVIEPPAPARRSAPPAPAASAPAWRLPAPAASATKSRSAPETRTRLVNRRATVRYYFRMNPDRMYPLLVVLSAEEIREIVQKGVSQAASAGFKVEVDSRIEVEPVLPGCDCYPPRDFMTVAPEPVTTTFYVVPRVMGRITAARVVLRQNGVVLATVPLDAKVSKQTLSYAFGLLGLVAPYATAAAKSAKLDPATQHAEGFVLYRTAGQWLLENLRPDAVGLTLFALAVACYWWFRPKRRDAFWDVDGKVPAR